MAYFILVSPRGELTAIDEDGGRVWLRGADSFSTPSQLSFWFHPSTRVVAPVNPRATALLRQAGWLPAQFPTLCGAILITGHDAAGSIIGLSLDQFWFISKPGSGS